MYENKSILLRCFLLTAAYWLGTAVNAAKIRVSPTTVVQAVDQSYTFTLQLRKDISPNGQVVIRFPDQFEFKAGDRSYMDSIQCKPGTGGSLTAQDSLSCKWESHIRLLTMSLPNKWIIARDNDLIFIVTGMSNPKFAAKTDELTISTMKQAQQAGQYTRLDTMVATITATPGLVSGVILSVEDPTVAAFSPMTVSVTPAHSVPFDGKIVIDMPKWNSFALDRFESLVSVSTSPGEVSCSAVKNMPKDLFCVFVQGAIRDQLEVSLGASEVAVDLPAGTQLQFKVQGVRAPPSLTPIKGFSVKTTNSKDEIIDETARGAEIQLAAFNTAMASPASVHVSAQKASINKTGLLQLRMQTQSPLPPKSKIRIMIPTDFGVVCTVPAPCEGILEVDGKGSSLDPAPKHKFDNITRELTIFEFNIEPLQSLDNIGINFGPVKNPAATEPTSSFAIYLMDNLGNGVESVDKGITFTPLAGTFSHAKITTEDPIINKKYNEFKFEFIPEDSFTINATLKIVFPREIYVTQQVNIKDMDQRLMSFDTVIQQEFNRQVLITNSFKNGYDKNSGQKITFTLAGVTNPISTATTEPFQVSIFYEEGVNEVTRYTGKNLVFKAIASDQLQMSVALTEKETGESQTKFTITGETTTDIPIMQGSQLLVFIPPDFKVANLDRVQSSCTTITGFSDEIQCEFKNSSRLEGHWLLVKGGFDSAQFERGKFSFFLKEILNPFSTKETGSFKMEVIDKQFNRQYFTTEPVKVNVRASPFAYAYVQPRSQQNGASCIYKFTLTLGVDTPAGTEMSVELPGQLSFDQDPSKKFHCKGTTNIASAVSCYERNGRVINLILNSDERHSAMLFSGTTISFELGYILNPPSFQETNSFVIKTFRRSKTGVNYQYINYVKKNLAIENTVKGVLTDFKIEQMNGTKELGAPTTINMTFSVDNEVPQGSRLVMVLPSNLKMVDPVVTINGIIVKTNIDERTFLLKSWIQSKNARFFQVSIEGLENPQSGPYSYDNFMIDIQTHHGYPMNGISTGEAISTPCDNHCQECKGKLATCLKCGYDRDAKKTFYLNLANATCLENCVKGFYAGAQSTCRPCSGDCTECKYGPTSCLRCKEGKGYANNSTLRCYEPNKCPLGSYADHNQKLCVPCDKKCEGCSSATKCTSCDRSDPLNRFIYFYDNGVNGTCEEKCPAGTVQTPSKICQKCYGTCATCSDLATKCDTCVKDTFLYKSQCKSQCPIGYIKNDQQNVCLGIGQLDVPIPFTILAAVVSFGLALSSCMTGADNKTGKIQQGTAFFVTTLACIDILLRLDWIMMAVLYVRKEEYGMFFGLIVLLFTSAFLNLVIWRNYFHTRYRYDRINDTVNHDPSFTMWMAKYPKTSSIVLFISYVVTFQAIRFSYSRLLAKKQFMASFTKKRRFFRLLGRLSILQTLILYIPAIGLHILVLVFTPLGTQLFYYAVDGLVLVAYSLVLIAFVITQREKVLDEHVFAEIRDMFQFDNEMIENCVEVPDTHDTVRGNELLNELNAKQMQEEDKEDKVEIQSATMFYDLGKRPLYQNEGRYRSLDDKTDQQREAAAKRPSLYPGIGPRPMSVIDYNAYRKLEEKKERIILKKKLYDHKRETDRENCDELGGRLVARQEDNDQLVKLIKKYGNDIGKVHYNIKDVQVAGAREAAAKEQRKREEIIQRRVRPSKMMRTSSSAGSFSNNSRPTRRLVTVKSPQKSPFKQRKKSPLNKKDFVKENISTAYSPLHQERRNTRLASKSPESEKMPDQAILPKGASPRRSTGGSIDQKDSHDTSMGQINSQIQDLQSQIMTLQVGHETTSQLGQSNPHYPNEKSHHHSSTNNQQR